MIQNIPYDGLKSDIWSIGVVLCAMIVGKLPFDHPKTTSLLSKIIHGDYDLPDFVSKNARDLISKIFKVR